MAVKKRRKARKSGARKRKKRNPTIAANPRRRRRLKRSASSRVRRAPRRRRRARAFASNPRRRVGARRGRARSYRRRRNPGSKTPSWAIAGLAGLAGLASYALVGAGTYALTQRIDDKPGHPTLDRNRYIAGGVSAAAGLALAIWVNPLIGAGVMTGGLINLAGTDLYLALGKVLDKDPAAPTKQVSGLFVGGGQAQQLGIGGIYQGGRQQTMEGVGADGRWSPDYGYQPAYG